MGWVGVGGVSVQVAPPPLGVAGGWVQTTLCRKMGPRLCDLLLFITDVRTLVICDPF